MSLLISYLDSLISRIFLPKQCLQPQRCQTCNNLQDWGPVGLYNEIIETKTLREDCEFCQLLGSIVFGLCRKLGIEVRGKFWVLLPLSKGLSDFMPGWILLSPGFLNVQSWELIFYTEGKVCVSHLPLWDVSW